MSPRRELATFGASLALLLAGFFAEPLAGRKVLSPADVLLTSATFRDPERPAYEPHNRLLMDPVLQFQPWLERTRSAVRRGQLPLWNFDAGCGTPHLANGQSAVFDPFHLIAYLGPLPLAHAWMAWARLWVAGVGMFLLARRWGLGPWGRWFSGVAYPLCGFMVLWLLYPVTSAAVWMPWLFLATDRALDERGGPAVAGVGLAAACTVFGGHIQTSAMVLTAVGLRVVWRLGRGGLPLAAGVGRWTAGVTLGLAASSVATVPFAFYLSRSPVWSDRQREAPSPLAWTSPRWLDSVCTAMPYAYGSQRRGHPNLARALGVHNVNESAGGYAGLATLLWLGPQAWLARRARPHVTFLAALAGVGFLGSFGFPPVVNVLRALPVFEVVDHRRLTLWVAFGLVLLGGTGLDHLDLSWRPSVARWWVSLWLGAALGCGVVALALKFGGPTIEARASAHYAKAAGSLPGTDASTSAELARRQTRAAVTVLPRVYLVTGVGLLGLTGLAVALRRGLLTPDHARPVLAAATLVELLAFGYGVTPAIDPRDDRPASPALSEIIREFGPGARVLGVGAELPPNVAMRCGLADPRNYDSVEVSRSLRWFAPLYEAEAGRALTSRRLVTWQGVVRAADRLREAGVVAAVGAVPPPQGLGLDARPVGSVWLARLDASPLASAASGSGRVNREFDGNSIRLTCRFSADDRLVVRETFDPGWKATVDGTPAAVRPYRDTFLSLDAPAGTHVVVLTYDPPEVRHAAALSLTALAALVFLRFFRPAPVRPFFGRGLGRPRAPGLESTPDTPAGIPDRPITEG